MEGAAEAEALRAICVRRAAVVEGPAAEDDGGRDDDVELEVGVCLLGCARKGRVGGELENAAPGEGEEEEDDVEEGKSGEVAAARVRLRAVSMSRLVCIRSRSCGMKLVSVGVVERGSHTH